MVELSKVKNMSTKVKKGEVLNGSTTSGLLVYDGIENSIVGNILEVVEALGLEIKQENSIKSIIRDRIWRCFDDKVIVDSDLNAKIHKALLKKRDETNLQYSINVNCSDLGLE